MKPEEYRAEAYRVGHQFARGLLGIGKDPETIRVAMDRAQERLRELRAYSADLEAMMRGGVEEALVAWLAGRAHLRGDAGM
jgi:hypothetical protein